MDDKLSDGRKTVKVLDKRRRRKPLGELSQSSLRDYAYAFKFLEAEYGFKYELMLLNGDDLTKLHEHIGVNNGPVMANRVIAHVSGLIGWAKDWKMLEKDFPNPALEVAHYKEYPRRRTIRAHEGPLFKKTLELWLTSNDPGKKKIARLIVLCLKNSNRRGEWLNGRLSWIDWDTGEMLLRENKTGGMTVTLGNDSLGILKDRYEEWEKQGANPEHDWIIPGRWPDKPLKEPKDLWKDFLSEAKLEDVTLHDLRRSFGSIALSTNRFGFAQTGQVMGHSNISTTKRYAIMMPHAKREVINVTNEHIDKLLEGNFQYLNKIVPESIQKERDELTNIKSVVLV